jgi:uncharacterized lipoprotein YehR (DUF1307 family)
MKSLILCLALLACGSSARQKTLSATLASVDIAAMAIEKYDASHQQAIVSTAATRQIADSELAAYYAERAKVVKALTVAYQTIAAAAVADSDPTVAGAVKAAADLAAALHTLGVEP